MLEPPSDFTLAQVAAIFTEASGMTLADLVASLPNPNAFTLNDLLIAVLRAGAEWEQIDLTQPALARRRDRRRRRRPDRRTSRSAAPRS